jgi:hypothetical protein
MQQNKRQRRDANAWRELLGRFADSGLTIPAFCEREAISEGSFYRWRTILQRGGGAQKRGAVVVATQTTSAAAPFVDLGTLQPAGSRMELKLDLGGGMVLQLVRA